MQSQTASQLQEQIDGYGERGVTAVHEAETAVTEFARIFEIPKEDASAVAILHQQLAFWQWLGEMMDRQVEQKRHASKRDRQRRLFVAHQRQAAEGLLKQMKREASRPLPDWAMKEMAVWVDEGMSAAAGTAVVQ